jgi:adenosylmethionine-8-amino-7-oxononanoate aminotransferase
MATVQTTRPGGALWSPQAHMPTIAGDRLTIVRGHGANVQTDDGRWLLDATAGLWHANIGHGRERLAEAAAAQMRRLETYHTFGRIANDQALTLADRVAGIGPIEDAKVFLGSGGSDAVDTAAKLARRYWQLGGHANKRIIISRDGGYHGLHAFGTSLAGIPPNREGYGSESLIPETARVPTNDADALEATILHLGADRVAAVFAEPVVGTGGVIFPADGYLERVEEICRQHDVLLVLDEVITGFGRTGEMFGAQRFGVSPDMLLMAKGITSGYAPLGGVLIAPRVWSPFFDSPDAPIFRHGVTYSGHATACAVAQANLDVLAEEDLVARVAGLIPELERALSPLRAHPLVQEVRTGPALVAGVQMSDQVSGEELSRRCLEAGVLFRVITNNTVQISPPFIVEAADLERIASTLLQALHAISAQP